MTVATLIALLVQYLPSIIADAAAVQVTLTQAAAALANAKDGVIAPADWAVLDAATQGDLAALHAAAGRA